MGKKFGVGLAVVAKIKPHGLTSVAKRRSQTKIPDFPQGGAVSEVSTGVENETSSG